MIVRALGKYVSHEEKLFLSLGSWMHLFYNKHFIRIIVLNVQKLTKYIDMNRIIDIETNRYKIVVESISRSMIHSFLYMSNLIYRE